MYAIEFNATVRDGKIEIPLEYKKQFATPHNVKVILLKKESDTNERQGSSSAVDTSFGMLSNYANPALMEREAGAWERAAVEKHDIS